MNLEPIRALLELAKGVPADPWYTVDSVWLPGPDVPTYVIAGHPDPHVGKPVVDAFLKDEYAEGESEEEAVSEADAIMAFCAQARNSVPAISQLLEAVTWIKCSERMPERGQWCLVIWKGYLQHEAYQFNGDWVPSHDDDDHVAPNDFSHWMPLPLPPEDTK